MLLQILPSWFSTHAWTDTHKQTHAFLTFTLTLPVHMYLALSHTCRILCSIILSPWLHSVKKETHLNSFYVSLLFSHLKKKIHPYWFSNDILGLFSFKNEQFLKLPTVSFSYIFALDLSEYFAWTDKVAKLSFTWQYLISTLSLSHRSLNSQFTSRS